MVTILLLSTGWLAPADGDASRVKCTCCGIELDATIECLEKHQASKEHAKNAVESEHNLDAKTGIKYQKRWHMNPLFSGKAFKAIFLRNWIRLLSCFSHS